MEQTRKIIIVDDEKHVLESVCRTLRRPDYHIMTFDDAVEALTYIKTQKGEIDIIISDNKMPHTDGTTLLVAVRKIFPDIIRIMLTGHSTLDDAKRAINEGEVYRFLTKPCDPDELRLVVRHGLAHKDLWNQVKLLSARLDKQETFINQLEDKHPGITHVARDERGNILVNILENESLDSFLKKYSRSDTNKIN